MTYNETMSVLLIATGMFLIFGGERGGGRRPGRAVTGVVMAVTGLAWWAVTTYGTQWL